VPNIRWLLKLITTIHRFVYTKSGGRIGGRLAGRQMLLLTHVGRRSGETRVAPLLYVSDGSRFVVAASNAGDDRAPAWWLNLKAKPDAVVQAGRERVSVRAREVHGDEEDRLWRLLSESYGPYRRYREKTSRRIPVVVLDRV
jgi:deazaflavin-dependent oxidoreductase (nitroreductase family)